LVSGTRRFRLRVEYDGTEFAGFQYQAGLRTVQEVLETAVTSATGQFARVHGSGRTDAGVHALGQEVHFDVSTGMSDQRLATALNALLPRDVSVRRCRETHPGFHVRYDATGRLYRYAVWHSPMRSAVADRFTWQVTGALDFEAMRQAGRIMVGLHDFGAFGKPARPERSTVRCVRLVRIENRLGFVLVWVEGNAFLRHMVRAMVGTLVSVGRGRTSPDGVAQILLSRDPSRCPPIAPAKGLCLFRVNYAGKRIVEV
jgi:tRNA pseudouridine38-40 synthase